MGKMKIIKDFMKYAMEIKAYWMIPLFILFLVLGIVLVVTSESTIAPFIYSLF